ncbi:MAG: hypothetical protein EA357_05605 [Micavibrio sp.]|nr:MAG: hypothetical protein EA357_05605 [Micavibrio sp.]
MTRENKKWLMVIAAILIVIVAIMLIGNTQETRERKVGESIGDVIDSAGDSAKQFKEDVIDKIDDPTTNGE